MNTFMNLFEELNKLYEADEVFADEAEDVTIETDDDAAVEAEETSAHRALVCAACGAISIVAADDVEIDEESDLANVDVECEACNKAEGFKVIGDVTLYDGAMEDIAGEDDDDDEEVDGIDDDEDVKEDLATSQILTEGKIIDAVKKVATRVGADAATIVRSFAELGDIITKRDTKFYEFAEYIENKAVLKALMNGNESVLNSCTKEDIEDLEADIKRYEQDKKDGKLASAEDIEEGLLDFGKKKREAERKRQEEEEAARKAEQEKSKSKWPTAADYDAYEREQREQRRIDAEMAQYKAMGQGWNKRDDSSSPSNTPYVGVNYSGGDYF